MIHQMVSVRKKSGLQVGHFSTQTCLLQSHVVVHVVVRLVLSWWKIYSKTRIYFSALKMLFHNFDFALKAHLKVHFNELWPIEDCGVSGWCWNKTSSMHDRALINIYGWHIVLCLETLICVKCVQAHAVKSRTESDLFLHCAAQGPEDCTLLIFFQPLSTRITPNY